MSRILSKVSCLSPPRKGEQPDRRMYVITPILLKLKNKACLTKRKKTLLYHGKIKNVNKRAVRIREILILTKYQPEMIPVRKPEPRELKTWDFSRLSFTNYHLFEFMG